MWHVRDRFTWLMLDDVAITLQNRNVRTIFSFPLTDLFRLPCSFFYFALALFLLFFVAVVCGARIVWCASICSVDRSAFGGCLPVRWVVCFVCSLQKKNSITNSLILLAKSWMFVLWSNIFSTVTSTKMYINDG